MVKFDCVQTKEKTQNTWTGKINSYTDHRCFYEIKVDGSGPDIRIIFGNSESGNFICLPQYGVSCDTDAFSDSYQNYEKLAPLIGEENAITVSQALNKMSEVLF